MLLKNALLVPLKHALLALLKKKIKLLKKLYCFTCATERNQWAPLKKSDCSISTTEKCSTSTSEHTLLVRLKKNQTGEKIVLLHLCHLKKLVGATEKIRLLHWHH